MKATGIAIIVAIMALASVTLAVAQYPPPTSPIVITANTGGAVVGQTIQLTVTVTEPTAFNMEAAPQRAILASMPREGVAPKVAPALAVGPYNCTSAVSGGAGATVSPASFTTDAAGVANLSLYTGTQPSTLTVSVQCGQASGQALIAVAAVGGTAPTAVPGAPTVAPGPPNTGTNASGSSVGSTGTMVTLLAAVLIIAAGAGLVVLQRSRTSDR